jgi:hypothetical protein
MLIEDVEKRKKREEYVQLLLQDGREINLSPARKA